MKRVGRKKKIILPIILVLTGALLTTSLVVYNNLTSVSADATFDGVTNIVKNKNDTGSTFNILELVPQKNMGTIGYLVSGQEPDDISDSALSAIVRYGAIGTDDRVKYISALKNKLASITSEQNDDSKPLYYENYEESYVQGDESWTELTLAGDEVISANTQGYSMQNVGSGNGDYDLVKYVPVGSGEASDSGKMCNQNVDYYVYLDKDNTNTKGYYNIEFKQVTLPAGQTNSDYFGVQGENGTYINKAYKLVKFTDKNNKQVDKYVYVPYDEIVNDESYYEVGDDSVVFCADGLGKYGAVLNEKEPYVRADENSGASIQSIYNFVQIESSDTYSYVGENKGTYTLKSDKNAKLDKKVSTNKIYYKGGIKSNDWFRNKVLGEDKNVKIRVQTVTPTEFDNISTDSIDMLFISESSLDGKDTSKFKFGTWNSASIDINENTAKEIYKLAISENKKLPIVIDGKIDEDIRNNINNYHINWCPNIYKLAILLSCTEQNDGEGKLAENLDSVDKNQVQFKLFTDYKNGYLRNNIYTIPPSEQNSQAYLLNNFISVITDSSKATEKDGCSEVANYIKAQNKLRAKKKQELLDSNISMATNFSYIMAYQYKNAGSSTPLDTLKVLEIEPGSFVDGENGNWMGTSYNIIKKLVGKNCPDSNNVNITRVSMAEFIGRIEDLNQYDMVYMGLNILSFNTDSNGDTVYNDSRMNGLIYSNIGDIIVIDPSQHSNTGLLDTDYTSEDKKSLNYNMVNIWDSSNYLSAANTYRGSGNDITDDKIRLLKNYLNGNHPIVFAYGFFDGNQVSGVNDKYIDNSSKMYQFLQDINSYDCTVKVDASGNAYDLYDLLCFSKPKINLTAPSNVQGQEYSESKDGKLSLEFSVENKGIIVSDDDAFDVDLYIDSNLDGKFSDISEKIDKNDYKLYKDGNNVINPQSNGDTNSFNLSCEGGTYKLVYELPVGYIGVINWKLVVRQTTNSYRYDFTSGFVHMAAEKGQQIKVRILQICSPDEEDINKLEYVMHYNPNGNEGEEGPNNSASYESKFDDKVYALRDNGDYNLIFKTYSSDDPNLIALCNNNGLKNYDMIVLGFGYNYLINNDNGVVDAVKRYIEDGKPVIITRNVFTDVNNKNGKETRGLDANKILRDVVGMDRYGVISDSVLKKGVELHQKGSSSSEYQTVVNDAVANSLDVAYTPKSGKESIVKQTQGFTYVDLDRNRKQDSNYVRYRLYNTNTGWNKEKYNNSKELNRGQISVYPNNLVADTLRLTDNDIPFYQLNLNQDDDGDGETDLVVWYTLDSWTNKTLEIGKSLYDVRNNYYLYTMRNVTYCGMQQLSANGYTSGLETDLFINTIVTTYGTAAHAPTLTLKEGYDKNSPDLNVIYSSLDDVIDKQNKTQDNTENEDASLDKTVDAYFTITDNNSILNQDKSKTVEHIDFYTEGTKESHTYELLSGNNIIYLNKINPEWNIYALDANGVEYGDDINPIYDATGNSGRKQGYFSNGDTYKVKVSMSVIPPGKNFVKVYAVAYSDLFKKKKDGTPDTNIVHTPKVYKTFNVQRIGLADLD